MRPARQAGVQGGRVAEVVGEVDVLSDLFDRFRPLFAEARVLGGRRTGEADRLSRPQSISIRHAREIVGGRLAYLPQVGTSQRDE